MKIHFNELSSFDKCLSVYKLKYPTNYKIFKEEFLNKSYITNLDKTIELLDYLFEDENFLNIIKTEIQLCQKSILINFDDDIKFNDDIEIV